MPIQQSPQRTPAPSVVASTPAPSTPGTPVDNGSGSTPDGGLNWVMFAPDTFDSNGVPITRKKRRRTAKDELAVLEATYLRNAHPPTAELEILGRELNMTVKEIRIWFQNRRQAGRRRGESVPRANRGGSLTWTAQEVAAAAGGSPTPTSRRASTASVSSQQGMQPSPTHSHLQQHSNNPQQPQGSGEPFRNLNNSATPHQAARSSAEALSQILTRQSIPVQNFYPVGMTRSESFGSSHNGAGGDEISVDERIVDDAAQALLGLSQSSHDNLSGSPDRNGSPSEDAVGSPAPLRQSVGRTPTPPQGRSREGSPSGGGGYNGVGAGVGVVIPSLRSLRSMDIPDAPLMEPLEGRGTNNSNGEGRSPKTRGYEVAELIAEPGKESGGVGVGVGRTPSPNGNGE
ncbi:hypothetical protein HK097_006314, partial [Rhizophlyctis rosea]